MESRTPEASATGGGFAALLGLAREGSSDRRREMLRRITGAFLDGEDRNDVECVMFEDIVAAVSPSLAVDSRAEIAEKLADSSLPLRRTARQFAHDEIQVARPVLQRSPALTDDDLIEVAEKRSQDHLHAITKRPEIAERVSGALVNYGHDHVVGSLLENEGARIGRPSFEKIAERAETSEVLQRPFVERKTAPLDLLGELSVSADAELRRRIDDRLEKADPEAMRAALAMGERRRKVTETSSLDLLQAKVWIESAKKRKAFRPEVLVELLDEGRTTHFVVSLAHMCRVRVDIVRRVVNSANIDTLAILMKSIGAPASVFNSVASALAGASAESGGERRQYAALYLDVTVDSAQRAMRFWQVRDKVMEREA